MDRNEIIRIAQEAGLIYWTHNRWWMDAGEFGEEIECFAALIAAAEREACAKIVEQTKWSNWFQADCAAAIRARGN